MAFPEGDGDHLHFGIGGKDFVAQRLVLAAIQFAGFHVHIGSDAQRTFSQIRADVLFFATKALSPEGIISDCDREEVCLRQVMLDNAAQKIYLCAGEKFGHYSAYRQCTLSDVDHMVTEGADRHLFAPLGQLADRIL